MRAAKVLPVLAALVVALVLAGCGGDGGEPPRPTPPARAQLSPQRVTPHAVLRRSRVAVGFDRPLRLVAEPGTGRVLVVEQGGTARWLDGAGPAPGPPFLDVRELVSTTDEQGLLGLVFVPARDGLPERVLVHYTDAKGTTQVVSYEVRDGRADPATARPLLSVEQPYANHNGGDLVLGPDHRVYLGLGDGGSAYDPRQQAQDLKSQLGKILRMDPYAAKPRWRIVALGLRNPWRLSFDARTGELWVADAGRDSAEEQTEEIDRIPTARLRDIDPPVNLGWAAYEGAREQTNRRLTRGTPLLWPVASYTQRDGCSATGGLAVRSPVPGLAALRDRYVFGDACSGLVWSMPADAGEGVELRREGVRVPRQTSYLLDDTGRLLVSSLNGSIYRLRDR